MAKLPTPIGRQKEVVFLPEDNKYIIVLGTAGSGKTTMAVHRAINLQKRHTNPGEKTLIVTFNKMLVEYMKSFGADLPNGLCVENYHKTARGFLNRRGKMGRNAIVETENSWKSVDKKRLIDQALQETRNQHRLSILQRSLSLFIEEIKWIEQFGINNLENYIAVERIGRSGKGTRIERSSRPAVWQVYERYQHLREENGYSYDWDDLAITLEHELQTNNSDWIYRHVIIDEGQDLSPSMLRSLATAIPTNGTLTFFGDVAQQIYGIRVSWKNAGIVAKKSNIWQFQENYRNTKEIAQLALAISKTSYFLDEPDLIAPNFPRAEGPLPAFVKLATPQSEEELLIRQALQLGRTQSVAILVRKRKEAQNLIPKLKQEHVKVSELHPDRGQWSWDPGIFVGTYQAAKGLEFDTVLMPHCNKSNWPNSERINEVGDDEASAEDARLLYVGVTRARTRLIITFSGERTELLPKEPSLYQYLEG